MGRMMISNLSTSSWVIFMRFQWSNRKPKLKNVGLVPARPHYTFYKFKKNYYLTTHFPTGSLKELLFPSYLLTAYHLINDNSKCNFKWNCTFCSELIAFEWASMPSFYAFVDFDWKAEEVLMITASRPFESFMLMGNLCKWVKTSVFQFFEIYFHGLD